MGWGKGRDQGYPLCQAEGTSWGVLWLIPSQLLQQEMSFLFLEVFKLKTSSLG